MRDAGWESIARSQVSIPAHVVFRALGNETVLLNVRTGQYHGLDEVGSRFFAVMTEASDLAAASAILAAEYEQPPERIEADLEGFCQELQGLALIELAPPASG